MTASDVTAIETALTNGSRKVYKWEIRFSATTWVGPTFDFTLAE